MRTWHVTLGTQHVTIISDHANCALGKIQGLTGISRLWTWTLDPETVDFGLNFSPEHTAKIALILKNGLVQSPFW